MMVNKWLKPTLSDTLYVRCLDSLVISIIYMESFHYKKHAQDPQNGKKGKTLQMKPDSNQGLTI